MRSQEIDEYVSKPQCSENRQFNKTRDKQTQKGSGQRIPRSSQTSLSKNPVVPASIFARN